MATDQTEHRPSSYISAIAVAKCQSQLIIVPDLSFFFTHPMPGRWVRFWQWALLGWTWKPVEE